ncbi:IclR family transcriptional regulator [Amycolatopsis anabasis]|uniref:IclR family transcriptional regulator n=1 Tax=Amycolatopsis anabasis TaxID=1840409 RepID=UPI00131D6940|nr:IclR family transcriptional regulator [Amycolatopsis anabasis]
MTALDHAGTLERGLAILEHVGLHEEVSTNAIARELGLSRSAAYRAVHTLKELGYLEADPATGRVRLGVRLVDLALRALSGAEVRRAAAPPMRGLARKVPGVVYLAVPEVDGIDYVARESRLPAVAGEDLRLGARWPWHATASGKAWLAALPPRERAERVRGMPLDRLTPNTIVDRDGLLAELEQTGSRGWAIDNVESEPEIGGVAAAVLDRSGRPVGALTVLAPAGGILLRLDELGHAVRAAAAAVSRRLGHAERMP